MKKLLLLLSFLFVAFAASAANLNPFAYGLRSEFDETTMTLTGWFSVNAPSNKITVYAKDSEEIVYKILELSNQPALKNRQFTFSFQGHLGKDFTWYVDVEGQKLNSPAFIENSTSNKLYYPTSVDVDNNPENANFGTVFCIEGKGTAKENSYTSYLSYVDGVSLYMLNADGSARKMPTEGNDGFGIPSGTRYGYNGSKNLNKPNITDSDITVGGQIGFAAYRVRVSDDGRIFITAQRADGYVLWEAGRERFSATTSTHWNNYKTWRDVMASANSNTTLLSEKTIGSSSGTFYAGPNMGFDVRGSGKDLKLLMLSGSKSGFSEFVESGIRCNEYNLGCATKWEAAPSKTIFTGKALIPNAAQVEYDKNGNVWMCQLRYGFDAPTLMQFNQNGEVLYQDNPKHPYRRCGALRFNEDFTKFVVTSKGSGSGGAITVYDVYENGDVNWGSAKEYKVEDKVGLTMMDFAWDYADNLYIAADMANEASTGHFIAIYAMPRNENKVTTPAASKYAFSTKNSVTWKNLFLNEQDVADETKNMSSTQVVTDYTGKNHRLWRLLQTSFNMYLQAHSKSLITEVRNGDGDGLPLYVDEFFNAADELSVVDFFANDDKFSWLGDYLTEVSGFVLDTKQKCIDQIDPFINRTGIYEEKGKPEYWRPYMSEAVWGLDGKIASTEYMPIRWNWTGNDERHFNTIWVSYWNISKHGGLNNWSWFETNGYEYAVVPSDWYYFNSVGNRSAEGLLNDTHILAWRDGCVDGNIVHRVNASNTELYATYVEKKLEENDNSTPDLSTNPYDATNDDLIKLLNNKNYVQDKTKVPTHNLTVARKLQAGMYNTICLPLSNDQSAEKNLDLTKLDTEHPLYSNDNGTGATVLAFTGITLAQSSSGEDMTILNFTQVYQMQAGQPYLVKLKDGAEDLVTDMEFSTVSAHDELHDVPAEANGVKFTFVPTINPTEVPAGSLILVADNRLALTTKAGQMAGLRGYFTFSGLSAIDEEAIAEQAAEGRVLLNIKRPTATSVAVAPDSEKQNAPEVRKLMYDNQIYIIRDNITYTVTGLRVK